MLGTEVLADTIGRLMTEMGVKWERFGEVQTEEQRKERLGMSRPESLRQVWNPKLQLWEKFEEEKE